MNQPNGSHSYLDLMLYIIIASDKLEYIKGNNKNQNELCIVNYCIGTFYVFYSITNLFTVMLVRINCFFF